MNENTGNSRNSFFYDLLDNPADLSYSNAHNLQHLVNEFPQSGLLRSMLAVKREEENLQSASVYVNPKLLYLITNAAGTLRAVSAEQIAICQEPGDVNFVMPLSGGVDLPKLSIDESNYFHVHIDQDLVYIEDENAEETELLEGNNEDTDLVVENNEAEEPVIDQNSELSAENEENTDVAALSEIDAEVTEGSDTEEEIAAPLEIDTEATAEIVAEEDASALSELDAEVTEEDELAASSNNHIEVTNENDEQSALQLETEGETDENPTEAEAELEPVADRGIEEAAQDEEQSETPVAKINEEINSEEVQQEAGEVEEETDAVESFAEANETDANTDVTEAYHGAYSAEQNDSAITEDSKIGAKPMQPNQEIDDEVFEEIVSIEDIGLEQLALMDKAAVADELVQHVTSDLHETEEIATGDSYFVFEPTLPEDEEYHAPAATAPPDTPDGKARQHVSRYNDEKMPYSFMWWLDKTRKEHAAIYQPFAAEGKFHTETITALETQQPAADHLQQQYVENIFAVSAVVSELNVIPPKTDAPPVETKADKIIEKFIHEEPQIKHPSKVKLDSENKAKKSSEDRDELVTETLARIYTEQMLYHKAILTYKKLMLKFPEKSLYFAGQIEQLENKIN